MDVQFDPVGPGDANTLLMLAGVFHREEGHPLTAAGERALARIAAGEPFAPAWIVRQANEAVGYLVITLGFSVEYGGRDGFIDDLYLVPKARGQGIGPKLLSFALSQAAALGINTLHLEVETDNERAARLYQRAGFEATGRMLMRCHVKSAIGPR